MQNEGGCGEGEGKSKEDSVDQEPDVRDVLWLVEPGRHESLQNVQME